MKREIIILSSLLALSLSSPLLAGATSLPEAQWCANGVASAPPLACVESGGHNASARTDTTLPASVCVEDFNLGCVDDLTQPGSEACRVVGDTWYEHGVRSLAPADGLARLDAALGCPSTVSFAAFGAALSCLVGRDASTCGLQTPERLPALDEGPGVPWLGDTEVPGPVREGPRLVGEVMSRHNHLEGPFVEIECCFEKPYAPPGPTAGHWGCDRFSTICVYPDHMAVVPANGSNTWCRTGKPGILEPTQWTVTGVSAGPQFRVTWIMEVPQYGGAPDTRVTGSTLFYHTTEPGVYQTVQPFPPAGAFTLGTTFPDCRRILVEAPELSGTIGVWLAYGQ